MKTWIVRSVMLVVLAGGFLSVSAEDANARRRGRSCCVSYVSHCCYGGHGWGGYGYGGYGGYGWGGNYGGCCH
jgi:hypothetical protein